MGMNSIVGERNVEAAIQNFILQFDDHLFSIGNKALLYSEKHDKWVGSIIVTYVDGQIVTVRALDGTQKYMLTSFQVKPYFDV